MRAFLRIRAGQVDRCIQQDQMDLLDRCTQADQGSRLGLVGQVDLGSMMGYKLEHMTVDTG